MKKKYKKIKKQGKQWNFGKKNFWNPLRVWPRSFVKQFQKISFFGASQSELSIKSYDYLKFFCPKNFETLNL